MNHSSRSVCLLFRKPGRFFSIEKVFHQLAPFINRQIPVHTLSVPFSKFNIRQVLGNIYASGKSQADIYHITGDIHYVALGLPRRRTVLTIHDCVFLYQSRGLKRLVLKWLFLDLPVRRCRIITTISEATKADIVRYTGCPTDKLVVIPDPVDQGIYYRPHDFRQKQPVILFIGTTVNKNLERVVKALEGVDCLLDIVGRLTPDQQEALSQHHIRYRQQAGLTDEEMAEKYAGADLVLFPSTFEGFGLPIVEGQKAGRPVVTSDLSPMKETAGGAACLVDPLDAASIRAGVLRVIEDKGYRDGLVQEGFRNVERFAPERIALQYVACYEKLLNE